MKSSAPFRISTTALSTHQSLTKETATPSTYCAAGSGMLTIQRQRAVAPCAPQSELYQQGGPQFLVAAAWRQPAQFQLSEQQGEFAMPAILDTLQHLPTHHTNWPSHHGQCRVCGRAATLGSMLLLPADDFMLQQKLDLQSVCAHDGNQVMQHLPSAGSVCEELAQAEFYSFK